MISSDDNFDLNKNKKADAKHSASQGTNFSIRTATMAADVKAGENILQETIGSGYRLQSLDFYRGLIMVLLMLESSGIFKYLGRISEGTTMHGTVEFLFDHADWHALHFWDLLQPGFMFIAGAAMALSLYKQTAKGIPWKERWRHAWKRSGWLFFWGVLDYAVVGDHLVFELWDVLTQLSFTLLIAFLIFRWETAYQLAFSFGLLLLTELLYRYTKIDGFRQPFTDQHNFGNYVDLLLMHKTNPGGWVAINCLPTAAHTIWGAVAGKWLLTSTDYKHWMKRVIVWAIALLVLGYAMDWLALTPIIKRIATTSFTLVAGGWCLLALVFFYWWIDVRKHVRGLPFFTIVGMNSIFIYLFFEIVVGDWLFDYAQTLVGGFLSYLNVPSTVCILVASLALFAFQWYLCWWLYKKKIYFKV